MFETRMSIRFDPLEAGRVRAPEPDPAKAWRRGQSDPFGQFNIGDAPLGLQLCQKTPVNRVKIYHNFPRVRLLARYSSSKQRLAQNTIILRQQNNTNDIVPLCNARAHRPVAVTATC